MNKRAGVSGRSSIETFAINNCDIYRDSRTNLPEVVFASGKDDEALIDAADQLLSTSGKVLLTKCTGNQLNLLKKTYGKKIRMVNAVSGTVTISNRPLSKNKKYSAAVVAAGSSDRSVAEEAAASLDFFGFRVYRYYDCGIAGFHRLVLPVKKIRKNNVDIVIAVAGMEGALPSVIAGLVKQPVIAVPTSVGYGTGIGGVAALMTMLNSCSPGISVVNIDNGFGAAAAAYKMTAWLRRTERIKRRHRDTD